MVAYKPVLPSILGIPSYAIMMAVGYLAALGAVFALVPRKRTEPGGVDRPQAVDLFLVMLVSSLIGAKLGHVIFEAPGHVTEDGRVIESLGELLWEDPLHALRLGEGGYVWYGGMIGALLTAVVYFRRRPHLKGLEYADAFAPAVMVGAAFGRLGCFMAGCCYGVSTELPWGVDFPATDGPVHPTQIYDATFAGLCGAALMARYGRRRFMGENIALLLILYPVARFFTEAFRGDPERNGFGPFSTSQWISFAVLAAGGWMYVQAARRAQAPRSGAPSSIPEADEVGAHGPEAAPSRAEAG